MWPGNALSWASTGAAVGSGVAGQGVDPDVVRYEVAEGRATLTIDDPQRRNPLTTETMAALAAAVRRAADDENARVIVITGAGPAFSAGGDLAGGFIESPLASHGARGALADLFRSLRRCAKPTIARVNGPALGGGFGLAAACDMVIAAEDAIMGTPEIRVGLWPMIITAVLRPVVPQKALFEMMATGRRFPAAEGVGLGIVTRAVPAGELDGALDEVVAALLAHSPATLAIGKAAFYATEDMDLDTALDHLQAGLTAVGATEDAAEGVAAFVEKRDPEWRGR
ncbi:MAG TPA: enoyl-CoA hydratase-related protein [Acidimicrobiia bacterium]|jgi:enoyl-CoA hydratase/carnithine racemase